MLLWMVKLRQPRQLGLWGNNPALCTRPAGRFFHSLRWPDQSGGFGQSLPPCSSRLGELETCQAGLVKILSCKFILLAPISPRRGSLRTEAPGGPRLAKGPCEYTVTASRDLPGRSWVDWSCWGAHPGGWRPSSGFRAGGPGRQETGSRRPGRREAGGRQGQAG